MGLETKREKKRDTDAFDTTQLHESQHGQILHRDYSAHFFRWSFAKRLIGKTAHVLDVGCGQDQPLQKILFRNAAPYAASWTGVDLNKLKPTKHQHSTVFPETDFTSPAGFKAVMASRPEGFDVIVHFEIIEHAPVEAGKRLLTNCHKALKTGGVMIMSTPVYDGKRHAANHIHEYYVDELQKMVEKAKFKIEQRFGTFTDIKHIGKVDGEHLLNEVSSPVPAAAIKTVRAALEKYFDNDAISNIFGPLYPNQARNNLWVCRKL